MCKEDHQETEYFNIGKLKDKNIHNQFAVIIKFLRLFNKPSRTIKNKSVLTVNIKHKDINLESKGAHVPQVAMLQSSPVTIETNANSILKNIIRCLIITKKKLLKPKIK